MRARVTTAGGRESGRRVRRAGLQRGNRGTLRGTVGRWWGRHCRRRICDLGREYAQRQPDRERRWARGGSRAGLYQAHAAAEARAQQQIQSLSLKPTTIPPNGTESGYVFFPLGEYQKIQAVLGDPEAGSAITVSGNITH